MKQIIVALTVLTFAVDCSAQNTNSNNGQRSKQGPPSIDEIFKLDSNQDGKLSKSEIKGPLLRDFAKIDSNNDGFISKKELQNAPKPERGSRPPRNK